MSCTLDMGLKSQDTPPLSLWYTIFILSGKVGTRIERPNPMRYSLEVRLLYVLWRIFIWDIHFGSPSYCCTPFRNASPRTDTRESSNEFWPRLYKFGRLPAYSAPNKGRFHGWCELYISFRFISLYLNPDCEAS